MSQEPDAVALIDTSVLVRYLMDDAPAFSEQVRRLLDGGPELTLTEGTIAETAYVLTSVYGVPRADVVSALVALLRRRSIRVHGLDKDAVIQGLLLCAPSARVSFADAMLWAAARSAGAAARVYTLDARFPASGIDVRREW